VPAAEDQSTIQRFENQLAIQLFEQAFDEHLARSPERRTSLGEPGPHDDWSDPGRENFEDTVRLYQQQWQNISKSLNFDLLDKQNQLSYRLFEQRALDYQERLRYWHHDYVFHQMRGAQTSYISFLINSHPAKTRQDLEDYITRIIRLKPVLEALIEIAREQEKLGIRPPQFVYQHAISSARNIVSGQPFDSSSDNSPLLADFIKKANALEIKPEIKQALITRAKVAMEQQLLPTYHALLDYLTDAKTRADEIAGAWKLPDGDAYYNFSLKMRTTTNLTSATIHQLGLDEVNRIHAEMHTIMSEVGFKGSLKEFFSYLRTSEQFYLPEGEDGKQAYLDLATEKIMTMQQFLPRLFHHLPQFDLELQAVEPYREKSAGRAFYSSPAADGSRPGRVFFNLYQLKDMPIWDLVALAYYEGIPGHHMQRALSYDLTLPRFRKYSGFTAYSEGWGLYSEYLPLEYGFYQDPYSNFGRLATELWRAARLVVDTGLHAQRWSREQAIDYLVHNTPNSPNQAVKAIERYIVMPGQATAYKIGMLKILELREKSQKVKGSEFDIRDFHEVILGNGPLPLNILEEEVQNWLMREAD